MSWRRGLLMGAVRVDDRTAAEGIIVSTVVKEK